MRMSAIEKFFVNGRWRERRSEALARNLLSCLDLRAGLEVLDAGCGSGAAARYIARTYDVHVTAIDVDPDQVALAASRTATAERVTFVEADARLLPFEDRRFDVVLSFMTLHHIADWRAAVGDFGRVLRSGGHLLLADLALPRPLAKVIAAFGHEPPSVARLLTEVRASGLVPIDRQSSRGPFLGRYEAIFEKAPSPLQSD